jgi:hypothetical protein
MRGRPQPHLPGFDEIQDHLRLSSQGFLACMDKDQGGRFSALFFSIFSSMGLSSSFFFFFFSVFFFNGFQFKDQDRQKIQSMSPR